MSEKKIKILLVEDELIIAADMEGILSAAGYEVVGTALDFDEAIELLSSHKPDLLLLDVNLGGVKDGIDLATTLNERFQVPFIYTTSYSDSETLERAKQTNPINYLVKPFQKEQLLTAIDMALYKLAGETKSETPEEDSPTLFIKDALFIKDKSCYTKLIVDDIRWIKSDGNYLEIYTTGKTELVRASMSAFLERLHHNSFFRTHKSYAVNLDHMTRMEPTAVSIGNERIPISKLYVDDLLKRLNII
ncbi:MAG TPA: response regulator [Flavobacterium sp.]|nr:response regulator [Flavobacterium sp.]